MSVIQKSKVVSLRLTPEEYLFIEKVRGELQPGEAIRKIVRFLGRVDSEYTRTTILKAVI